MLYFALFAYICHEQKDFGTKSMSKQSLQAKCEWLLSRPFWQSPRTWWVLWMLIAVAGACSKLFSYGNPESFRHHCNNFLIFRGTFWHALEGISLYAPYPLEHADTNHYGPLFSVFVAPFALPPAFIGLILWVVFLTWWLYMAVRRSTFSLSQQCFIIFFCAHELLTAVFMMQFNIAIAAIILLSYYCVERERDFWAAAFIMLGTFIKLYGIVGLAFFFFSKHKGRFIFSLIFWAVIMLILPAIFHGFDYLRAQYGEWYASLTEKNTENLLSTMQNVSLLGIVRKSTGLLTYSDLWLIVPGLILFSLPYLRRTQYEFSAFRQTLLASVLMFVVLFSTGSESSSYIIALVGVVIWYTAAPWKRSHTDIFLMVFVFILTSLSPSDIFPSYLRREYVYPFALKALPVTLVWLKLCWEICTKNYAPANEIAMQGSKNRDATAPTTT